MQQAMYTMENNSNAVAPVLILFVFQVQIHFTLYQHSDRITFCHFINIIFGNEDTIKDSFLF